MVVGYLCHRSSICGTPFCSVWEKKIYSLAIFRQTITVSAMFSALNMLNGSLGVETQTARFSISDFAAVHHDGFFVSGKRAFGKSFNDAAATPIGSERRGERHSGRLKKS